MQELIQTVYLAAMACQEAEKGRVRELQQVGTLFGGVRARKEGRRSACLIELQVGAIVRAVS